MASDLTPDNPPVSLMDPTNIEVLSVLFFIILVPLGFGIWMVCRASMGVPIFRKKRHPQEGLIFGMVFSLVGPTGITIAVLSAITPQYDFPRDTPYTLVVATPTAKIYHVTGDRSKVIVYWPSTGKRIRFDL